LAKLNPAVCSLSAVCWPKLNPANAGLAVGVDEVAGVPKSPVAGVVDPNNWVFGAAGVDDGVVVSIFAGTSVFGASSESISVSLDTGASTFLDVSPRALLNPPPKNESLGSPDVLAASSFAFGSALNVDPSTKPLEPKVGLLSTLFAVPPNTLPAFMEPALGEPKAFEVGFEPNTLPVGLVAAPAAAAKPPFEANAANPED
jgi:hypothetical protein